MELIENCRIGGEFISRTDLALETAESLEDSVLEGVDRRIEKNAGITTTRIHLENDEICRAFGKPEGNYVTMELGPLDKLFGDLDEKIIEISKKLVEFIPYEGLVLVIGLGNSSITPDALGPKVASGVFATRHIMGENFSNIGLQDLRSVAVLAPGVLGQTGIEVIEVIQSICKTLKPCTVIVIDALAAKGLHRLGSTIQVSDSGILPGSGVGNSRPAITKKTLGLPVVSIGVPTVVDAFTLVETAACMLKSDSSYHKNFTNITKSMFVTPREIDTLIEKASKIVSMAINKALQPEYSLEDIRLLVN